MKDFVWPFSEIIRLPWAFPGLHVAGRVLWIGLCFFALTGGIASGEYLAAVIGMAIGDSLVGFYACRICHVAV